jgi:membrane protease YdiL (CAAX protease family)
MEEKNPEKLRVPQMNWVSLVAFILVPLAWWLLLLYVVTPLLMPFITTAEGEINGYALNLISLSGYLFEFLLAVLILKHEGSLFNWHFLKARLLLKWSGWKAWGLFVLLFILAFTATFPLMNLSPKIASLLPPPVWFPASQNPLKEVNSISDAYPGIVFEHNYVFLLLVVFTALMNIFGEDIYYRGVLIPKLNGLFGRLSWVAGGLIFMVKHLYVWWRCLEVFPLAFAGAFFAGPLGSLWFTMLAHFLGNYGMSLPLLIKSVLFG